MQPVDDSPVCIAGIAVTRIMQRSRFNHCTRSCELNQLQMNGIHVHRDLRWAEKICITQYVPKRLT